MLYPFPKLFRLQVVLLVPAEHGPELRHHGLRLEQVVHREVVHGLEGGPQRGVEQEAGRREVKREQNLFLVLLLPNCRFD